MILDEGGRVVSRAHKPRWLPRAAAVLMALFMWFPVGAIPAAAAGEITAADQWWFKPTKLDKLKARGLDGSGVTIAVIDGNPDLSVPELKGVDATVTNPCSVQSDISTRSHGTTILALLGSRLYGWAPKATFKFYVGYFSQDKDAGVTMSCPEGVHGQTSALINQAVTDGANIVSISSGGVTGDHDNQTGLAVARAVSKGVAVVFAAGNSSSPFMGQAGLNGVVGVGAAGTDSKRAAFSNYGDGLTVMAPGVDIAGRYPDSTGTKLETGLGDGTSFAAPMVAGALALAKQAFPNATMNQLERSLIGTALNADSWNILWGYGNFNPTALTTEDPSGFPDTNPFIERNPIRPPTKEQYADYLDGLVGPGWLPNAPEYIYRGTDPKVVNAYPAQSKPGTSPRYKTVPPETPWPPPSPTPTPTSTPVRQPAFRVPEPATMMAIMIGIIAVVVIGTVAAVMVINRRARHRFTPPPTAAGGQMMHGTYPAGPPPGPFGPPPAQPPTPTSPPPANYPPPTYPGGPPTPPTVPYYGPPGT